MSASGSAPAAGGASLRVCVKWRDAAQWSQCVTAMEGSTLAVAFSTAYPPLGTVGMANAKIVELARGQKSKPSADQERCATKEWDMIDTITSADVGAGLGLLLVPSTGAAGEQALARCRAWHAGCRCARSLPMFCRAPRAIGPSRTHPPPFLACFGLAFPWCVALGVVLLAPIVPVVCLVDARSRLRAPRAIGRSRSFPPLRLV